MTLDRRKLYQLPWTPTDNPGGWVQITDVQDVACPGCDHLKPAGHVPLAQVEADVLTLKRLTNCDHVAIAGGEPLLYPRLLEVVEFIARQDLKPILLTHGERLTHQLARDLRDAGLAMIQFHVDCGMQRLGWTGKNEGELNELRQQLADLVWNAGDGGGGGGGPDGHGGRVQCGFRITVYRSSLPYLPRVLEWARANLPKVRHIALVAYRAVPIADAWGYQVGGRTVDASDLPQATTDPDRLTVTSERMYEELQQHDRRFEAAAYLPGTAAPHTTKFLVAVQLGARSRLLGYLGPRALEAAQTAHHFLKGCYVDFPRSAPVGRKALLLAAVDPAARAALKGFLGAAVRDPRRLFDPVWTQTISIQQPLEFVDATANECSGCPELTVWQGGLIPSCRLDEYRWFGGPMVPVRGVRARVGVG